MIDVVRSSRRVESMRTVSVSYRMSDTAPNSLTQYRNVSNVPAAIAPVVCGSTMLRNTSAGRRPSARADSSISGGSADSRASTGRYTYG